MNRSDDEGSINGPSWGGWPEAIFWVVMITLAGGVYLWSLL